MKRQLTFRAKYRDEQSIAWPRKSVTSREKIFREDTRCVWPSRPYECRNECRKRKKAIHNARDVNESPGTSRVSWPKAKL